MKTFFKLLFLTSILSIIILAGGTYWVGTQLTAPAPDNIGTLPPFLSGTSVNFTNSTGNLLAGWYLPGRVECGAIILMHSIRSNRRSMVGRARFLHKAGYSILLFDFQAHGESEGTTIAFGALEKKDARAAVQFVAHQRPSAPIGVIGFSLGGAAAVFNGPDLGADALILEAVYSTLEHAVINRIRQRVGSLARPLAHILIHASEISIWYGPTCTSSYRCNSHNRCPCVRDRWNARFAHIAIRNQSHVFHSSFS